MRIFLLALAIGAISQVRAQANVNLTAAAELPQCVTNCAIMVYPSLNCTPADPCYCAHTGPVTDALFACVTRDCHGLEESLQGLHFQAESCGWERGRDVGPQTRDLVNALFGLATFFLLGRVASRWRRWGGAGYWWDDYVVFLVYIPTLTMTILGNLSATYGFGRDIWTVPIPDVVRWAKIFFWMQPLYVFCAFFTKLSLVLLYLRIFPATDVNYRQIRLQCKVVGVVLFLAGFSCVLANIFACTPISLGWRQTGEANGACVDRIASAYAVGSINAVLDIVVILLPIPRLLKLNVSLRQKIGVTLCFLVGFGVTAVTIVRLYHVHELTAIHNPTWTWNTFVVWCAVEVYASMICACMPPMTGLARRTSRYVVGKIRGLGGRKRLASQDEKSIADGLSKVENIGKVPSPTMESVGKVPSPTRSDA